MKCNINRYDIKVAQLMYDIHKDVIPQEDVTYDEIIDLVNNYYNEKKIDERNEKINELLK